MAEPRRIHRPEDAGSWFQARPEALLEIRPGALLEVHPVSLDTSGRQYTVGTYCKPGTAAETGRRE